MRTLQQLTGTALAVGLLAAVAVTLATPAVAEDTRDCVTGKEYRSIKLGTLVTKDFDGDGDEEQGYEGGTTYKKAKKILDGPGSIGFPVEIPAEARSWESCKGDKTVEIVFSGFSFDQPKAQWQASFKQKT